MAFSSVRGNVTPTHSWKLCWKMFSVLLCTAMWYCSGDSIDAGVSVTSCQMPSMAPFHLLGQDDQIEMNMAFLVM